MMYAKVLRFDIGFGRPQAAEQIVQETEAAMSQHPGFQSMLLLADYLGGRYLLIAYWDSDQHYYDFSYSADARNLEGTVKALMSGVPFAGFYTVHQSGGAAVPTRETVPAN
jgi:heme-degrading monooxygenase HmoA